MIDNQIQIEIPEGLMVEAIPAGPIPRFYAWLIDQGIRVALYMALFMTLSFLGEMGLGIAMILIFGLEWFYPVLFELFNHGATPGKGMLNLRVVQDDLTPLNWQASIIRNLLRGVDFLPVLYLFGLFSTLIDRRFRRLGDLAAGTLVIHQPPAPAPIEPPSQPPLAPAWPLLPDEQRAIVEFARRAPRMTPQRRDELARLTRPLVSAEQAPERLLGVARWILGDAQ